MINSVPSYGMSEAGASQLQGSNRFTKAVWLNTLHNSGHLTVEDSKLRSLITSGATDLLRCAADAIHASGRFSAIDCSKLGEVVCSGHTNFVNCGKVESVRSSGRFSAVDCSKLGKVVCSGHTNFVNCGTVESVYSSGSLSIENTNVTSDIDYSGMRIVLLASKVAGALVAAAADVSLQNSSVDRIIIKPAYSTYSIEILGCSFLKKTKLVEQTTIELTGKNCHVNSISFLDGAKGKVILKDGAQFKGVVEGEGRLL